MELVFRAKIPRPRDPVVRLPWSRQDHPAQEHPGAEGWQGAQACCAGQ